MTSDQFPAPSRSNPLLAAWTAPFGLPPFQDIQAEDFRTAFATAIPAHRAEVEAIAANPEPATFDNTVTALERAGEALRRVSAVFFNLTGTDSSPLLQEIERDIAPVLARHRSAIYLDGRLLARLSDLMARAEALGLSAQQARVLERYHSAFKRAGAGLAPEAKARMAAIAERAATLGTQFSQNVLADETSWSMRLDGQDLDGLPEFLRDAAARAASDRGLDGYVITLGRSSIEPFLQFSTRRDLRQQAFAAWAARGEAGATDNRAIIAETIALRAEKAALLGYSNFADFRLSDSMAASPAAAMELLQSVWQPARAQALRERDALQALIDTGPERFPIAAWDWRFYSEKRRKAEFDLDESALKPYLQLDNMIEAAFFTAGQLFGLRFILRNDLAAYHPDVRVYEVRDSADRHVGLFLGDYFARATKRSGAWMSLFRGQDRLDDDARPIVVNVLNFAQAAAGQPTLLSFDDARTLFHEFGHALHGLLSDVDYPSIAGTNVARDFVEFPSQLYEHWLEQPEILERFALHYRTGEPMPHDLLQRLLATRTFNQGFATVEYLASALVDLRMHLLERAEDFDTGAFEQEILAEIGMPEAMVMRHRPPHFQHVFSGDGYSSAYYSYLWSEVLDADGFAAFTEIGNIFDPQVAERLRRFVYAAGNQRKPEDAYLAFRGRPADPQALLAKRGLAA